MSHANENPMAGADAPDPTLQFYSVGFIAAMIQQPPHVVMEVARLAGVEPSYFTNGLAHFRGDHVQQMAKLLADTRSEVEKAAEAAEFN